MTGRPLTGVPAQETFTDRPSTVIFFVPVNGFPPASRKSHSRAAPD